MGEAAGLTFCRLATSAVVWVAVLAAGAAGCGTTDGRRIVLAATTSTHDSGLLDSLVARFEQTRPEVRVLTVVVGSGEALELGRRGDADVLFVHAPPAEERFMESGYGLSRTPVMYNDFVLVGPPDDPAGVRGLGHPATALRKILEQRAFFVSRGDSSGTHIREVELWAALGTDPAGDWYLESGQGQGTSLQIASERRAYALTDRATFAQLRPLLQLDVMVEGDPSLLNLYSVIVAARAANPEDASLFADWLTSSDGRAAIVGYPAGADQPLFRPLLIGAELPIPAPHENRDTATVER